jgi:hypothetical protein
MRIFQEKLIGKLRVSTKNGDSSILLIFGKLRVSTKNGDAARKIDWETKSFD